MGLTDQKIFYWINHSWANPVLDYIMPVLTDFDNWRIPVVVAFLLLAVLGHGRGRATVLMLAAGIASSDQAAAHLLKPLVGRIRPNNVLDDVRLLVSGSSSFSFPSAHSANMAAAALILSIRYSRLKYVWISIAVLVGISRVYVGVHYPLDVVGGAAVGVLCTGVVFGAKRILAEAIAAIKRKQTRHAP